MRKTALERAYELYPMADDNVTDDIAAYKRQIFVDGSNYSKEGMPKVVCICGSTRFTDEMLIKRWELEKSGIIVHTWNVLPSSYTDQRSHLADHEGVKEQLDELHKRKIDLSDEVYVMNIGGYIGESTRSEILYARETRKPVVFHEDLPPASASHQCHKVAFEAIECNACLFIKDCLEDILPDCTEEQRQAIERAKANNWHIQPGEEYRYYVWDENSEEEMICCEIPEIAEIVSEFDLYGN